MSDETSKVTYQTFVDDLEAGNITRADLYSYGRVDFTYITKDETINMVDIPHKASENSLLIQSLKNKSVEYTAHDESYPDEESNDTILPLSSSLIFLTPVLLIVVIIYQVRVISRVC